MKTLLISMLACGIALAQTPAAPKKAAPATKSAAPSAQKAAPAAGPNLLRPATLKARAPEVYKVKLTTTKGDVIIQVNRAWAPIGADRFYNLVRGGFFKDAAFFRIDSQFYDAVRHPSETGCSRGVGTCRPDRRSGNAIQQTWDGDVR